MMLKKMKKLVMLIVMLIYISSFVFAQTWYEVDDFRMFNRTLTQEEIVYIYHVNFYYYEKFQCIRGDLYILESLNETSGIWGVFDNQCSYEGFSLN